MNFNDLLKQSQNAEPFSQEQLEFMLALPRIRRSLTP